MRRPRIVVVGSINMDLVVRSARFRAGRDSHRAGESRTAGRQRGQPGGCRARLDAEVFMIGRVGDDGFGERLRAGLRQDGIDITHVAVTPNCASGLAIVAVEDSGENSITVIPGANGRLSPDDVTAASDLIREADVLLLQLEVPLETVLLAIELAVEFDTQVILDPAPAPTSFPAKLLAVDVACPNETEAAAITGIRIASLDDAKNAALRLHAMGSRHAVITLGNQGAVVCGPDGWLEHVPSFSVEAVDTTAAGDAFAAGLGVGLAQGNPFLRPSVMPVLPALWQRTRHGAQPAMPTAADVRRFVPALFD